MVERSSIDAYAAMGAGQALQPFRYSPKDLGPLEVEIAVTHCGICHSDLHLIDNDWGVSAYPLVPGHEIVGTVARVGDEVAGLRKGQRVGVGWLAGACTSCEQCRGGRENLCRQTKPTCVGRHGGYATRVIVDARFAAPIPDSLPSEYAAPLLCAGITVFASLSRHSLKPGSRVGVVGIGGLGHLAIQYAHAMACAVTAFSGTAAKEHDARRLGADRFVLTSGRGALSAAAGTCDFILTTVPVDLPWADYMNVLKPDGKLCIVGASPGQVQVSAFALIDGQKSIGGSAVGANAEICEMLAFSAAHDIKPMIELFAMNDVNLALDRVRRNDIRYRAVLVKEN